MFVRACMTYSSFLAGGLAGQGLRNVTLCGDRACGGLKRMVKCEFWFGSRQPSAEIVRVECSKVRRSVNLVVEVCNCR